MTDVVLPALSERRALPWVLSRMPHGYRPSVVDNGSDDGTGEATRALGARVVEKLRRGFGTTSGARSATAPRRSATRRQGIGPVQVKP
jgi:hypothetical protein